MDEQVYTLEEIEGFCLGSLPKAKRSAFEARLETDNALQHQVKLIQSILDGFSAIRSEDLAAKMKSWARASQETEDAEVIEWYMGGDLGRKAQDFVEKRRETDPEFEALFKSQESLLDGFEAAREASFVDQMAKWEEEAKTETPVRRLNPWIKRLSIASAILLLVGIGGRSYMKSQYSNDKLFASFYQMPNIGGTLGGQNVEGFKENFSSAHRSLQAQQFDEAIQRFTRLQTDLPALELDPLANSYYEDNLQWSLLLAQLGNDSTGQEFYIELQAIADDASHEYQSNAQALLDKLNSFWR
mgnify:CR=1 FL=1